jgi:hypothetical protein
MPNNTKCLDDTVYLSTLVQAFIMYRQEYNRNNGRLETCVPSQICTSYHINVGALKCMAKLECCALATETGSKLTGVSLGKMPRLCLFEPGTLFSGTWTEN